MKKIFVFLILSFISINQTFAGEWKQKEVTNKDGTISIYRTYYNNNQISQNENGVSIEQLTKDSEWKIIEVKYLTKTKRPVINKAIWVSKKIFKHDTKKGIIEVNFYWLKSEKKEDINWCWGYIYILDKYTNNVSTKWCLTTTINERIKLDKSGVATYIYYTSTWMNASNDKTGFDVVHFRGIDSKPIKNKDWFTWYAYALIDSWGGNYSISIIYYNGTKDKSTVPWVDIEGINNYTYNFKDWVLLSRNTYGIDKLPIEDKDGYFGYTLISLSQDWWYKSVGISFQGKDRNKKNDSFGVSSYLFIYNSSDKLIETKCQNSAGSIITCPNISDTEMIKRYQSKIWEKADFIKFPTYNSIFE